MSDERAPERKRTDDSLESERRNTDDAIEDQRRDHAEADELVEKARDRADAVLDNARDKADDRLDGPDQESGRSALATERAAADQVLEAERAAADETLQREREEHARALLALLPLEREKTDRNLHRERARSDDALAQRDDFLGIVSHDLRNLLAGISSTAILLSAKASATDEGRRSIAAAKRIQRSVSLMTRLLGDLIDIASLDAGKLAVLPERTDAAPLLVEVVDAVAAAAAEKGVTLELEAPEESLPAELDRTRILQVLANLVGNALKFTPAGGSITVRGERAPDGIALSVLDTGVGIPADMLKAVFERFVQVAPDDRRGLGLGLFITRCIVDAHGGTVWAERRSGGGSAFHVSLPARSPRQRVPSPAGAATGQRDMASR
jgi:signal transduction histidine kinase